MAPFMATDIMLEACMSFRVPPKVPIAVRHADTITTSVISEFSSEFRYKKIRLGAYAPKPAEMFEDFLLKYVSYRVDLAVYGQTGRPLNRLE